MTKENRMHQWVLLCLVAALIAAVFGFGTVPKTLAIAGQLLFFLLLFTALAIFTAHKLDKPQIRRMYKKNPMDDLNIKGDWKKKKGQLKQTFTTLTEEDLNYIEGREDVLIKRIQQRLGASKQEARNIIRNTS